jgi:large subunit ribosomal protein L4
MAKKIEKKTTGSKKGDLTLPIFDQKGTALEEKISLQPKIFKTDGKLELLAQYVRVYLANNKPKTGSTKTRGEVTGSTRKIYRQKGTGRARHGDIKAPIFVGGGVAHGPKPRYSKLTLTKKQKRKALFLSLSLALKENRIVVLDDDLLKIKPKTKTMVKLLQNFSSGKKSFFLLVLPSKKAGNLLNATKNIPYLQVTDVTNLNPYLILKYKKILFLKEALSRLNKIYLSKNNEN